MIGVNCKLAWPYRSRRLSSLPSGRIHRRHAEARFGVWGVVGINLRAPRLGDLLAGQDHLYARTLRDGESAETRVIGSIRRSIDIEDAASAEAAIAELASAALRVITMTVTEKGYGLVPATGALDRDNPFVKADLAGGTPPRTLLGLLALALARRREANAPGLTLISCDNVPSNGALLRSALLTFAGERSAPLARWIEERVAFPCSMVDRIVPATTAGDIERIAEEIGVVDDAAVFGEPFRQWVIEDHFAGERPQWDLAGVQFVRDAKPYETIKMRVLNGAQSTLSHLGAIVGHEFSFEAAADPLLLTLARRMLETEIASTLPVLNAMAVQPYIESSLARIRNAAIRHRCHQIGTDGSQKIRQRILDPLRERLAGGRGTELLTLAAASWIAYCLGGAARFGRRWAPSDPWAGTVIALGERVDEDFAGLAKSVLDISAIFGTDLATPQMAASIGAHLRGLLAGDARTYLTAIAARDERDEV